MSARQRMINMMYIVLTAMLALNVSSDVLNGFSQVEDGLSRTGRTLTARNMTLLSQLEEFNKKNPEKAKPWLDKANEVRQTSDALFNYIDSLKTEIVTLADGKGADHHNIVNKDNLDASSQVMLGARGGKGQVLRTRIDQYRSYITSFISDEAKRANIEGALSTTIASEAGGEGNNKKWEETMFENMPAIAAVTLLSKLQNDVRYAEGEVLNQIIDNVDLGDLRVNLVNAFVVPQSRIVMRGTKYSANIVLAAVDTTQRPVVYIGGSRLGNDKGLYEVGTTKAGTYDYSGYIEVLGRDGTTTRRDFKSSYTVIDPLATVSATMMNVLYAGIANPISIAVPGVPEGSISATMTNGSLTRNGNGWVAHPTQVGAECVITVTAEMDGQRTSVGTTSFKVRKLPDPTPYIAYSDAKGQANRYLGGRGFAKALLLGAGGIGAAIDDGILNIEYQVLSFEMVRFDQMGNALVERSAGSKFSERQVSAIKQLQRGKRIYINHVQAKGPDGITRDLPTSMEIIIN